MCCIINEAAQKYKGIIPEDRWKQPYMAREKLEHEIEDGVWEGSFTQKILIDSRASNRNFGGSGGQEEVRSIWEKKQLPPDVSCLDST